MMASPIVIPIVPPSVLEYVSLDFRDANVITYRRKTNAPVVVAISLRGMAA